MKGTVETTTIMETLCPFYFRKCKLKKCKYTPAETDIEKWKQAVKELETCDKAGASLSRAEYNARQERVTK